MAPGPLVSVSVSINRCTCLEVLREVTLTEKSKRIKVSGVGP